MIDEMAHAAGKDPVAYRRLLLANAPRELAVLELAVAKAGWDRPMEQGYFRGVAVHSCFGSYVAQVVEISISQSKILKVERVVCAIDCGQVVNPDLVIAQAEGGIIFGLNAVIFGEMPIKQGKVTATNFTAYKLMRMHQAPRVEVYRIDSTELPGGAGEITVPSVGPALVNAVFAATGDRITELPVLKWGYKYP
jgi:isoquinoline 1-oxidoreductase beta subunit